MPYSTQERKILKCFSKLGFSLVIILVLSVTYVFNIRLFPLLYDEFNLTSVSILACGNLIAFFILYDLLQSSFTSPGYSNDLNCELDLGSVCQICDCYKPPRSHHCSICNKCVLEMDHHCPWINNCVGLYNKYFFYRFVISCILGGLYLTIILGPEYFRVSIEGWEKKPIPAFDKVMIKILFPLGFSIFIVVGLLMGFQAYLIVKNMTTLEYLAKKPRGENCYKRVLKLFIKPKINEL